MKYYQGKDGKDNFYIVDNWNLNYYTGTANKYLIRAGKKEGESEIKDIQKAIEMLIAYKKLLEENNENKFLRCYGCKHYNVQYISMHCFLCYENGYLSKWESKNE